MAPMSITNGQRNYAEREKTQICCLVDCEIRL